jgi:hypothetical protein
MSFNNRAAQTQAVQTKPHSDNAAYLAYYPSEESILKPSNQDLPENSAGEIFNSPSDHPNELLDQSSLLVTDLHSRTLSLTMEDSCALNEVDIPLVGEVDHSINKCFCYLCSCGKHICPGDYRTRHAGVKLSMASTYKKNFNRRVKNLSPLDPDQLNRLRTRNGVRGSPRMDLVTINKQDFVKFDAVEIPKAPLYSQAKTTYDIPFLGRSNYQANFPNWGPTGVPKARHASLPYRGDEIHMDIGTTYTNQYKRHEIAREENELKKKIVSALNSGSLSPINTNLKFFSEATSHKDYKAYKKLIPTQIMNTSSNYSPSVHSPSHFNTLYRESYMNSNKLRHLPTKKDLTRRVPLDGMV